MELVADFEVCKAGKQLKPNQVNAWLPLLGIFVGCCCARSEGRNLLVRAVKWCRHLLGSTLAAQLLRCPCPWDFAR